jgi:nucleotide-binding universal stress UspA family protein
MRDTGPILVPLDGSDLAEGALPYATALAHALGAGLVLVTVWEGADIDAAADFPSMVVEIEQKATEHYNGYLDKVRSGLTGLDVKTELRRGDPVHEILGAAGEHKARALVIATHGRSGISRWMYGSTAGRLLREATLPVQAVGPRALERDGTPALKHIVVPLDGSEMSEAALPVAVNIARTAGARISLVRAVKWAAMAYPYTLPDAYLPQLDDELEAGAKEYLKRKRDEISSADVDAFVVRGGAADGIIEFAEQKDTDLVVMTTHARTGLKRVALGSVADRMLQGPAPVMLVPPGAVEAGT